MKTTQVLCLILFTFLFSDLVLAQQTEFKTDEEIPIVYRNPVELVKKYRQEKNKSREVPFSSEYLDSSIIYMVAFYDPEGDWEEYRSKKKKYNSVDGTTLSVEDKKAFEEDTEIRKKRLYKIISDALPTGQQFEIDEISFWYSGVASEQVALVSSDENFANVLLEAKHFVEDLYILPRGSRTTVIYNEPATYADPNDWSKETGYEDALKKFRSGYRRVLVKAVLDVSHKERSKPDSLGNEMIKRFLSNFDKKVSRQGINSIMRDDPEDSKTTYFRWVTPEQLDLLYSSPLVLNIVPGL